MRSGIAREDLFPDPRVTDVDGDVAAFSLLRSVDEGPAAPYRFDS